MKKHKMFLNFNQIPGEVLNIKSQQKSSTNPAKYAVDGDKNTCSKSTAIVGETMWLEVKLDQIFCISHIMVYQGSGSSQWACSGSRYCEVEQIQSNSASNSIVSNSPDCPLYHLEVSTEKTGAVGIFPSRSTRSGCSYGDTITFSRLRKIGCGDDILVYEIDIMGNLGKLMKFFYI